MLIEDVFGSKPVTDSQTFHTLRSTCSQFIKESAGYPLYRNLPTSYNSVHKVKVRAKKRPTAVGEAINRAFEDSYTNLTQRAVFASSVQHISESADLEPFYVFPINGFKFLYSKEVSESTSNYQRVMEVLLEQLRDEQAANDIVADLLKFTYTSLNLDEGINSGSEIIMYGIPYYYAVRCSAYPDYARIVTD